MKKAMFSSVVGAIYLALEKRTFVISSRRIVRISSRDFASERHLCRIFMIVAMTDLMSKYSFARLRISLVEKSSVLCSLGFSVGGGVEFFCQALDFGGGAGTKLVLGRLGKFCAEMFGVARLGVLVFADFSARALVSRYTGQPR